MSRRNPSLQSAYWGQILSKIAKNLEKKWVGKIHRYTVHIEAKSFLKSPNILRRNELAKFNITQCTNWVQKIWMSNFMTGSLLLKVTSLLSIFIPCVKGFLWCFQDSHDGFVIAGFDEATNCFNFRHAFWNNFIENISKLVQNICKIFWIFLDTITLMWSGSECVKTSCEKITTFVPKCLRNPLDSLKTTYTK
jgi:hypothetical protein